jgi:hypothetical protein
MNSRIQRGLRGEVPNQGRRKFMGITDLARPTRECLATGVDRDEGDCPRLKVLGTRTPNPGVDILSHRAVR